jgi:hypothetical protein
VTKRKPLPVSKYLQPCPDCAPTYRGRELLHELTCPLMAAVEDVCDEDARWFAEHPGESTRIRPITRAELQQLAHTDPSATAATQVIVLDCRDGRVRSFVDDNAVPLGIMLDFNDAA